LSHIIEASATNPFRFELSEEKARRYAAWRIVGLSQNCNAKPGDVFYLNDQPLFIVRRFNTLAEVEALCPYVSVDMNIADYFEVSTD
jgi:hypothetical protein